MEFIIEVSEADYSTHQDAIRNHVLRKFDNLPVKNVLLVNPPDVDSNIFDYDIAKRGRANNYPAYGLGVIAKHLEENGFLVRICNLNHEVLKAVAEHTNEQAFDYDEAWQHALDQTINEFNPDLVAVTCVFTVTHPSFVKVCQYTKNPGTSGNTHRNLPLVIGGVHVTHDIVTVLQEIPEADYAFLNESELAFIEFLKYINSDGEISNLGQIVFRFPDHGLSLLKAVRPMGSQLDIIPSYDLMDITSHVSYGTLGSWYGFLGDDVPVATVQSNRGCRAFCTFCNVRNFNGVGVRQRSISSVIDELTLLHDEYGIRHIIWLDDDLLKNESRAIELFNEMVKKGLKLTWDATNGVIARSLLKEGVLAAASESGCIGLNIGIESGNREILRSIRKPGKIQTFLDAANELRKFPEINARALLIIGFPDETLGMIFDTITLAEKMQLDWHNISILQPWKNTPIFDAMVDQGLLGEEGTLKTQGNEQAPYQLGTYSRQRAIEKGLIGSPIVNDSLDESYGFLDKLKIESFDVVPHPDQLDDLWFYVNIRLNFSRLFREERKIKLKQQLTFLKYVSEKTAPDNALIMYFYALLQWKVTGRVDHSTKTRLDERLRDSDYWQSRFRSFGLDYEQVRDEDFPKYISYGGVPRSFSENRALFEFPTEAVV